MFGMNYSGTAIPPLTQNDEYTGVEERPTTPPRRVLSSIASPFSNRVQSLNTQVMRTASVRDQEH
jgi:hypothetical protein